MGDAEMKTLKEKGERSAGLKILAEAALYAGIFLVTFVVFLCFKPTYEIEGVSRGCVPQSAATVCLLLLIAVACYLRITGKLTARRALGLILAAGLILRLATMVCTPAGWYTDTQMLQMDTYNKQGTGHEGYAWRLFSTWKLPENNDYQFYHPPLNAFIQACFMRFMSGAQKIFAAMGAEIPAWYQSGCPSYIEADRYFLYSSCQILCVMYSFAVCIVCFKIFRLFNMKGAALIAATAFVVFYPRGIGFSGQLNNDGIAYLLSVCALYFVLKWWKKGRKLPDILLCALCVGLGMSAKMSSVTVCMAIAAVFVYEFVLCVKATIADKKAKGTAEIDRTDNVVAADNAAVGALSRKTIFLQYGLFLLVCAPIGLWFQIYAKIRFDQPFGYVFDNLNPALSTAGHTYFERFFPIAFDAEEYFGSLWCRVFAHNYNLLHFAVRSSIFGEYNQYSRGEAFALSAVVFAYIALILLTVSIARAAYLYFRYDRPFGGKRKGNVPTAGGAVADSLVSRSENVSADKGEKRYLKAVGATKEEHRNVFFVFFLVLSQVVSMIYFNVKMPFACTMDFRYIMPMIPALALTLWLTVGRLRRVDDGMSVALIRLTLIATAFFLISSSLFYLTFN